MTKTAEVKVQMELDALDHMTTAELVDKYKELHGHVCRTRHRRYLIRKVAWRIQANAMGGLSERARKRAEELANDADVRVMAPKTVLGPNEGSGHTVSATVRDEQRRDPRLPSPGTAIIRQYKGRTIRVIVLDDDEGFEWEGERYRTLTAIARKVTGGHINGFRFFRLTKEVRS
ncbi:MAG: DUF2924 domain-containing protein [Phycisphaerales bacterium]